MCDDEAMSLAVGSLVAWGAERGEALDPVAADAVVHLLALSGAKVRDGLPEATPDLVRVVLLEALPQFLPVSACAEGAALEVLRVLADRTRVDGRLNAKRHTRLREAVDACAGEHQRLMTDPRELTSARFWDGLLRARGVDVRNADAVEAGLEELSRLPYAERAALLCLPEAAGSGAPFAQTWALGPYRRGLAVQRQTMAAALLGQQLTLALMRSDEAPWILGLLGEARVERLMEAEGPDTWLRASTDAGLEAARRWAAVDAVAGSAQRVPLPVPGPRLLDAALVTAVGDIADRYAESYGDELFAVPHPLPKDRARCVALLRDSGLLAPAARLAEAPPQDADADAEEVRFALLTDFLDRDAQGALCAGPSLEVWRQGDEAELVALAVRALVGLCERIGADAELGVEYEGEVLGDVVGLCAAGGQVRSVARDAAVAADWVVSPTAEIDAPVEVVGEEAVPYELPPVPELERLLRIGELDERDVADLEPSARLLVGRLDLLAEAGVVWRRGDAYGLTPMAAALVREALMLAHGGGWPTRDGERAPMAAAERFPTMEAVLALDADRLVAGAQNWEEHAAHRVLHQWLAAGNGMRWPELLAALAAPVQGMSRGDRRRLVARMLPDAPAEQLIEYTGDPLLGAWAAQVLRAAGQDVAEESVPLSSRLLWWLERLQDYAAPAWRETISASGDDTGTPEVAAFYEEFDRCAEAWPDGGAEFLAELARAEPFSAEHILELLEGHPDGEVARQAEQARAACEKAHHERTRELQSAPGRGRGGKSAKKRGKRH
ncbi:hypothetical protein [Streptomyces sp. WAC00263]|uniref:hypothetical protein n=1 Tax=Streptomyces sp. WAC00263 TaxID=1917422 RepID=UPI0019D5BA2D|nr:hypothetical protein [Streptomyces sp. WAC00263]